MIKGWSDMYALIGQHVAIVLDWDDPAGIVHGELVSLSDDGEVGIFSDKTGLVYSWPALGMVPLD